jgi:iron complex outermembrane receptor protein
MIMKRIITNRIISNCIGVKKYQKTGIRILLFLFKGKGYYENYKEDRHGGLWFVPVGTVTTTDLVRQKWLDNDFYGTTFSANYKSEKLDVILGGGYNKYEGNHFGK